MLDDLRASIEELAAALSDALGEPVGLSPAHMSSTAGAAVFIDAPTLSPLTARMDGQGGVQLAVMLVGAGQDREQVLNLYERLPLLLDAVPDSWALGGDILPNIYAERLAYRIPLAR